MISENLVRKIGKIIKIKDKTLIVEETVSKRHPIYRKDYRVTTKYQVHYVGDPKQVELGEMVVIIESRPISSSKRWRFEKKLKIKSNK